jgi:hypothetical protein
MHFLNIVKKDNSLSSEAQDYIKKYQHIYKKVPTEAKKEIMIAMSKRQ